VWSFGYPIEDRFYSAPVPLVTIPKLQTLPPATLPVDSADLARMAVIPFLVNYMDGTISPDGARFWLAYDDDAFFLAGTLVRPDHGRDDVIEDQLQHEQLHIVLNPTPKAKRGFRVRLKPDGVITIDAGGEDAPATWWSEEGELVQRIEKGGWSFALKIPFHLLGVDRPNRGDTWTMNLFRYEYKRQEDNSSWSVMYLGRIDIPERNGEIVFGGEGSCAGILEASVLPGRSRSSFWVRGPETKAEVEAAHSGESLAQGQQESRWTDGHVDLDFMVPDGGEVLLTLKDGVGEIARFPVSTGAREIRPELRHLRTTFAGLARSDSESIRGKADSHLRELKAIEANLAGEMTHDTWSKVEECCARMLHDASVLRQRASAPNPEAGSALQATNTLTKIIPGLPLPGSLKGSIELKAPRRGSDSCQLVILAYDRGLRGCEVAAGVMRGPEGSEIGPNNIEIFRVGYVATRKPRYVVPHVGPHPDPLLPCTPFDVPVGGQEVLWMTVKVPEDAVPGRYLGEVRVISDSGEMSLPLELTVWGFSLPVRRTLRTAFPMFEREIEGFYGRPLTPKQRWKYYDFLLDRGISPSCQYEEEPKPRVKDVGRAVARGSNVVSMGYMPRDNLEEWIAGLSPIVSYLRKRGWLDLAYVYGFDEVGPAGYEALEEAYGKVRKAHPGLPRCCTIGPEHELERIFGTVDIWVPQTDRFEQVYKDRQASGDKVWWYVSMWPRHPFANMFVDYPAIDHRILFWQTWKYGIEGFMYYCINLWSSNCRGRPSLDRETAALVHAADREAVERGARWPEVPWNTYTGPTATNGDGQLVYPGPDGGPLSSVRLECIRHGIEDYELLAMLKGEVEKLIRTGRDEEVPDEANELLRVPSELSLDLIQYTQDPEVLLDTRARLGDLVERLSSL
jgi:hypothetical protein